MYKGCECQIEIDELNTIERALNQKRVNIILGEIAKRIDTSAININIYWQGVPKGFDRIFGPDEKTIEYAQRSVSVRVNCDQSFHIKGESQPFTGHHVWTHKERIIAISQFVNGLKHGRSYHWGYQDVLSYDDYNKGVKIK